ncbi:MinD/ParA family protein [Streptomyces griseoflavus]|uniref:MinD/ParA family protein n=1 Tax=Streptomyces griseoflavus TaxID=35619 RepID=UPI0033A3F39A
MTQGQGEQRQPSAHGGDDWQRDVLRELGGSGRPGTDVRRAEPTLRLVHPAPPQPGTTAEAHAGGAASAPHDVSAGPASGDLAPRDRAADAPDPGRPAPPAAREPRLPAAPPPDSSPTLDPRLLLALGSPVHGDSVSRRTGRALRKLTSSVSQDVAEQTRIARELQQPVTTGRVVAVTSIRGGVGKSTVSALLGRTLNHYRHDPVLTLEADTALGTLPVRMGAEAVRWTVADLAPVLHPSMRLTDVTGYLVPVSDGGWLLPASRGQVGPPLDMTAYRKVTLALRRYFAVTVADCETLPGVVARTAMDTAHARVVVAPTTAEGVGATRQVLDWLARLPHSALATTVVALVSNTPDTLLDDQAAAGHLKEAGVTVVTVPYDRHLAGGGPIRTDLLAHATRQAVLRLAAEVMGRAVRVR